MIESGSWPIDGGENESRLTSVLESSFTSLDIYDEWELKDIQNGDVTYPAVDVDTLVQDFEWERQDFVCELQHIAEEFSVMSDMDFNVYTEVPCKMEVLTTVSNEAFLEQEGQQESSERENDMVWSRRRTGVIS